MEAKRQTNRMLYIDMLNIFAALSVVWIHFGNEIHWYDGSAAWKMCVPIQVLAYWAVPVFFMISGATLMNYRQKYSTKVFFERRIIRGLMPYLIWGGIMMIIYRENVFVEEAGIKRNVATVINSYINNSMEPVYWFFLPLLSVYLSMPVLSILADQRNRSVLRYAIVFGVVLVSVIPFTYNLFYYALRPNWGFYWNGLLGAPILGGYTLYCVLGYWAATHDFTKKQRIACYIVGAIGVAVRFAGLWHFSIRDGVTSKIFMDYMCWPSLTLALAVFVAFRYVPWNHLLCQRVQRITAEMSACCLGVYVTHSVLIRKMGNVALFTKGSFAWYYLWPIPTFLVCMLGVSLARRVPLLRRMFP